MNTQIEADVSDRGGFSQSALVRAGWTQTMIATLLGEPDHQVENPYYASGSPMRLYDADRVRAAEATEAFQALQSVLRRKNRKPAPPPNKLPRLPLERDGEFSQGKTFYTDAGKARVERERAEQQLPCFDKAPL